MKKLEELYDYCKLVEIKDKLTNKVAELEGKLTEFNDIISRYDTHCELFEIFGSIFAEIQEKLAKEYNKLNIQKLKYEIMLTDIEKRLLISELRENLSK